LDLAAAGMLREDANKLGQGDAMKAWEYDQDFQAAIESDPQVTKMLTKQRITESFSVSRQLANIDRIFDRVFPNS